jgi:hypothetical protein
MGAMWLWSAEASWRRKFHNLGEVGIDSVPFSRDHHGSRVTVCVSDTLTSFRFGIASI